MAIPESAVDFMARQVARVRGIRPRKRIVFPEGADPRILEAAARLAREGLADPILLAKPPASPPAGVVFLQPESSPQADKYAAIYLERRRAKGITRVEAAGIARRPEYFGQLMLAAGDADGSVTNVQFLSGGSLLASLTGAPYTFTMSNAPAGNYTFAATATDNRGVMTTSAVVNVFVLTNAILTSPTWLGNGQFQLYPGISIVSQP